MSKHIWPFFFFIKKCQNTISHIMYKASSPLATLNPKANCCTYIIVSFSYSDIFHQDDKKMLYYRHR